MNCLTEEQLLDLYYNEEESNEINNLKEHIAKCENCQKAFSRFCLEIMEIEYPVIDSGNKAVERALELIVPHYQIPEKIVHQKTKTTNEILTVTEAAKLLKVEPHNILNMLSEMPYFKFDNEIRFRKTELLNFIKKLEKRASSKAPEQLFNNIIPISKRKLG